MDHFPSFPNYVILCVALLSNIQRKFIYGYKAKKIIKHTIKGVYKQNVNKEASLQTDSLQITPTGDIKEIHKAHHIFLMQI